jgi:hypothetical protein
MSGEVASEKWWERLLNGYHWQSRVLSANT